MNNIIIDFYTGYEGGGEIQFIQSVDGKDQNIIRICGGYFDDIMEKIEPESNTWTSLAYCYNLVVGWYDESPWEIPHLFEVLKQVEKVKDSVFRFERSKEVLDQICILLQDAIENSNKVYIARE